MMVDGQKFDGGDPQGKEIVDDRFDCQSGIGSPKIFRKIGMGGRHSADMGFVDDSLGPGRFWGTVASPDIGRIDHHAQGR